MHFLSAVPYHFLSVYFYPSLLCYLILNSQNVRYSLEQWKANSNENVLQFCEKMTEMLLLVQTHHPDAF